METQSTSDLLKNAEDLMYQKKILDNSSKKSAVIKSVLNTLYLKSPWEDTHSKSVGLVCEAIEKAYHLSANEEEELKVAGELHDIGKIGIGYRLLGTSSEYYNIAEYVLAHHERWDGTGYPKGLKGENIHWKARVIALAEAYAAMTCESPYRKALSKKAAITEIEKNSGTQFDPAIVKVFIKCIKECMI